MRRTVVVVGAGIVGVSVALALQDRGFETRLVGDMIPGKGASIWNAGVLASSSLLPMGNPRIYRQLLPIILGRHSGVHLDYGTFRRLLPWSLRFLYHSRASRLRPRAEALHKLIVRSASLHSELLLRSGNLSFLEKGGWLFLYRSEGAFEAARQSREFYRGFGVKCDAVTSKEVMRLEPGLLRRYAGGLYFGETMSVTEPRFVLESYLSLFKSLGGLTLQAKVDSLLAEQSGASVKLTDGSILAADEVVVATGAWTTSLLSGFCRLPMVSERGYSARFAVKSDRPLVRPIFDVAAGLVMAPRPDGVQVSTGTHLTLPDRPMSRVQFDRACQEVSGILDLSGQANPAVEFGDRPTLPDGLPAIGSVPGHPHVWLATGHQHIGFSTATASAELLSDLMMGTPPCLDPQPFSPDRFMSFP